MIKQLFFLISIGMILTLSACAQKKSTDTKPTKQAPVSSPANSKLFGANLIKNGDAEAGNSDGWTNADELKTILYGEFGGGPTKDSPGPKTRGDKYFYARTTTEQPTAVFSQTINISEIGDIIDKVNVDYNFGGWFGVANGSSSAGRLKISFLNANGKEIAADATEEITEATRPADEVLVEKTKSGKLPAGTRKIVVVLEFKIFEGHEAEQDNLAFADNLSLVLAQKQ